MLGEYVFLRPGSDRLVSREVYDVFFTPTTRQKDARFLCLSPHSLVTDAGELRVRVIQAPGAGGDDDEVYKIGNALGSHYDEEGGVHSVMLTANDSTSVHTGEYSGKVIADAAAALPEEVVGNAEALDVMCQAGTLFELALGDLVEGQPRAFRLVVEPVVMHTKKGARDAEDIERDAPRGLWRECLKIICPKTCRFNYAELLRVSRQEPSCAQGAAILQKLLVSCPGIVPSDRTRIVVIAPSRASIDFNTLPGTVYVVGEYHLSDQRVAAEWAGGGSEYWIDDIENAASNIIAYLENWARGDPKPKEAMTSALGLRHANTSLLVDALAKRGVLVAADPQRGAYSVSDLPQDRRESAIREIAWDPGLVSNFNWLGYEVQFSVKYLNPSGEDLRKAEKARKKRRLTSTLALVGAIASAVGLIIGIIALVIAACRR